MKSKTTRRRPKHEADEAPATKRTPQLPVDAALAAWRLRVLRALEELRRTMPGSGGCVVRLTDDGLDVSWGSA
jgi:hypothetical protein